MAHASNGSRRRNLAHQAAREQPCSPRPPFASSPWRTASRRRRVMQRRASRTAWQNLSAPRRPVDARTRKSARRVHRDQSYSCARGVAAAAPGGENAKALRTMLDDGAARREREGATDDARPTRARPLDLYSCARGVAAAPLGENARALRTTRYSRARGVAAPCSRGVAAAPLGENARALRTTRYSRARGVAAPCSRARAARGTARRERKCAADDARRARHTGRAAPND